MSLYIYKMLQYIQPLQCSFCTNVCFVLFVLDIIMARIKKQSVKILIRNLDSIWRRSKPMKNRGQRPTVGNLQCSLLLSQVRDF